LLNVKWIAATAFCRDIRIWYLKISAT
jgi:hypothetical protein